MLLATSLSLRRSLLIICSNAAPAVVSAPASRAPTSRWTFHHTRRFSHPRVFCFLVGLRSLLPTARSVPCSSRPPPAAPSATTSIPEPPPAPCTAQLSAGVRESPLTTAVLWESGPPRRLSARTGRCARSRHRTPAALLGSPREDAVILAGVQTRSGSSAGWTLGCSLGAAETPSCGDTRPARTPRAPGHASEPRRAPCCHPSSVSVVTFCFGSFFKRTRGTGVRLAGRHFLSL